MTLLKLISKCIMKISFEAMEVSFSVGPEKKLYQNTLNYIYTGGKRVTGRGKVA